MCCVLRIVRARDVLRLASCACACLRVACCILNEMRARCTLGVARCALVLRVACCVLPLMKVDSAVKKEADDLLYFHHCTCIPIFPEKILLFFILHLKY